MTRLPLSSNLSGSGFSEAFKGAAHRILDDHEKAQGKFSVVRNPILQVFSEFGTVRNSARRSVVFSRPTITSQLFDWFDAAVWPASPLFRNAFRRRSVRGSRAKLSRCAVSRIAASSSAGISAMSRPLRRRTTKTSLSELTGQALTVEILPEIAVSRFDWHNQYCTAYLYVNDIFAFIDRER